AELVGGTDILHAPAGEQISAEPEDEGLPSGLEVSVSSKGLAVVLLEDGQVKIRFRGQQLTGLEKFGSLPGYVLLALSLQIYGDKTHVDDLSERAERLGGEIDRNLTTEVLRAMSRNIQVEGKPLIKEVG